MTELSVDPGQALLVEPSPKPAETTPAVAAQTTPELPLTREAVSAMIAEVTARAIESARELGKRELQSAQDRNRAELSRVQRRATLAESILGATRTHLQGVDPDVAKELELAELRAREQGRTTLEQEETLARQQAEFHQNFVARQAKFIADLGIDPKDTRIDWATDAKDYLDAMERIQGSVAKIQKENIKSVNSALEARLKVLEGKVKAEETEANSVETTISGGVVSSSDADFRKKFATGDLPLSKANIARYDKILNT